ncbi:hypothetical protein [Nonomuraea sp. NEAU-A123]|uniref:hypothetical protein n=1 Tax=Nonomuraea sp. NEAU-A123 TaxID=2839649 RepID=UPI001BE403A4|nr:hypothetical protein [Nonomuraea sp. NEAU-A123]MBT2234465.1 hypothetical protein [Nonomuraea sp. NEAU-A123]
MWVAGLRLEPSTLASYKKNIRLHLKPYDIGKALTGPKLTAHYRYLEESGRKDHKAGEGLSARTVRYVHTILSAALSEAVDAGLLGRNPGDKAKPPTAKQAKAPEIHPGRLHSSRTSWSGRATTATCTSPGTSWRTPACAAASCSRCAGGTSTWRPERSASAGRWPS